MWIRICVVKLGDTGCFGVKSIAIAKDTRSTRIGMYFCASDPFGWLWSPVSGVGGTTTKAEERVSGGGRSTQRVDPCQASFIVLAPPTELRGVNGEPYLLCPPVPAPTALDASDFTATDFPTAFPMPRKPVVPTVKIEDVRQWVLAGRRPNDATVPNPGGVVVQHF